LNRGVVEWWGKVCAKSRTYIAFSVHVPTFIKISLLPRPRIGAFYQKIGLH
jgi:hypothetical protein